MQVQHIRQREDWDCGVACVAMLAGLSYDTAHRTVTTLPKRRWLHGITRLTMGQLLQQHGLTLLERRTREPRPVYRLNLVEAVPTGSHADFHWVVMLGDGTVLDPEYMNPQVAIGMHWWKGMGYHRIRAVSGVYDVSRGTMNFQVGDAA